MSEGPKPNRFQFGLRAIFWAMTLAAPTFIVTRSPRPFGNWTFVVLTVYWWCIIGWIFWRRRRSRLFPKISDQPDALPDFHEQVPLAPNHRWFTFSLRALFLTVTACSLVAAWWSWNLNKVRQRDQLLRSLEPYREKFDWGEWKAIGGYNVPIDSTAMKWLMFSSRRYYAIELFDGRFTTEDVGGLHALFPESEIWSVDKEHLDANGDNIRLQRL